MLVIGLTGGIGSGKSTVAGLFAKKGITIIDTDIISREITQPGKPALAKIVEHFGESILLPNKSLDRAKLRLIIFSDHDERAWLEQLLHPLIRDEMHKQVTESQSPYCIAVIPLLLESKPNPLINRILVVDTHEAQQIKRVQSRDNASNDEVEAILKTQVSRAERLKAADDIIENTRSMDNLSTQVSGLHEQYLLLSKQKPYKI